MSALTRFWFCCRLSMSRMPTSGGTWWLAYARQQCGRVRCVPS
jgi:hypothetical protein